MVVQSISPLGVFSVHLRVGRVARWIESTGVCVCKIRLREGDLDA
jgi:hypothetical protein